MDEPTRGYVPALDGLRAIAIIWVILFHSYISLPSPDPGLTQSLLGRVAYSGFLGVDLFFVLSGFLITGVLLDARDSSNRARTFYARRTLRIFPVYYAFLAVLSIAALVLANLPRPTWANWLYLSNFDGTGGIPRLSRPYQHLWSLAIEEQYYLAWPWLIFFTPRTWAMRVCIGLLITSVLARFVLNYLQHYKFIYYTTPMHLDGLVIGSWIALAERSDRRAMLKVLRWGLPASILLTTAGVVWRHGLSFSDKTSITIGVLLISLLTGSALISILQFGSPAVLSRNPLKSIGKYSYAIYLFHWPILLMLSRSRFLEWRGQNGFTTSDLLAFAAVTLASSFTLAWLSWHLLEKRFLALKAYFPVTTRERSAQHG